jgi:6-pyruvoyl-tetrahydropterin synthase
MVMDLAEVRDMLGETLDMLDHDNLNNHFEVPTMECVAHFIYVNMEAWLSQEAPHMVEVTVWETDDGGVTYDGQS